VALCLHLKLDFVSEMFTSFQNRTPNVRAHLNMDAFVVVQLLEDRESKESANCKPKGAASKPPTSSSGKASPRSSVSPRGAMNSISPRTNNSSNGNGSTQNQKGRERRSAPSTPRGGRSPSREGQM
jgi:hypothetical protein